jgi:hypothetical protein
MTASFGTRGSQVQILPLRPIRHRNGTETPPEGAAVPSPRFYHRLTGGRPMRHVCFCFTDTVSGGPVHYWIDAFGNPWLANGPWSRFRVSPAHGPEIWTDHTKGEG